MLLELNSPKSNWAVRFCQLPKLCHLLESPLVTLKFSPVGAQSFDWSFMMCSPNKNLHTKPWSVYLHNLISIWNEGGRLSVLRCVIILSAVDLLFLYQNRTFPWQLTSFSFMNVCMKLTHKLSWLWILLSSLSQHDERSWEGRGRM